MQISKHLVASIHYTLKNDSGEVLDSSEGQEALEYLHGAQNIVAGLEKELEGKKVGDKLSVVVSPDEAYGEYDPNLVQELPREMFAGVDEIEVGMEFHAQTEQGMQIVEVKSVDKNTITVDGNIPLAGETLYFDVEIMGIREATADKLENGHIHVHGPDCDH